ncbi:hypothetical protein D3C73_1223910 [compost metagenome]
MRIKQNVRVFVGPVLTPVLNNCSIVNGQHVLNYDSFRFVYNNFSPLTSVAFVRFAEFVIWIGSSYFAIIEIHFVKTS